jgi:hypothetical protein
MKYFYIISISIIIILLGVIAMKNQPVKLGDSGIPNTINNPINGSVTLKTNTSTIVLNANSGRIFANICSVPTNTTGTFLTIGTPATLNNGIYLPVGSCYTINSLNNIVGTINAFSTATNTLSLIYQ